MITYTNLANSLFIVIAISLCMGVVWLIMHFLYPTKQLENRYFKKPHFTSAELTVLKVFPGNFTRTMIFMGLCLNPNRGKKRQILNIYDYVPNWYVLISKAVVIAFIVLAILLFSLFTSLGIYDLFVR